MRYGAWNRGPRIRGLNLPQWQLALLLTAAVALGMAVAIVATGVFLIVLPIAALAVLVLRLFGAGGRQERASGRVIDAQYEVVDRFPGPAHERRPHR
jgi:hypothetical protein